MEEFLNHGHVDLELRDIRGQTLLHEAVRDGYETVMEKLLEYGANPFTLNDAGETTVHTAARRNNPDLVLRLIGLGVDADLASTLHKTTPLHMAALYGCVDVIRILIEYGVDQSRTDLSML
ncbi:ankyrin repeat-containing domain protein [Baffinella frigidus]|nr:ankyrin repeat-containing domain protein [Cryptophyta sp. CCMP2293]